MAVWSISSPEAEEAVVGGILVHPRVFAEVAGEVTSDDFAHPKNEALFEAFVMLDRLRKPIDLLTVVEQMRVLDTFDKLNAFRGADHLKFLMSQVPSIDAIGYHAKRVARLAERRRMAAELAELSAQARDESVDLDGFTEMAEARMLDLLQRRSTAKFVGVKEGIKSVVKIVQDRYERFIRNEPPRGVLLGIPKFDRMTGGLKPKQLVVIAARPSVGKSAFAGNAIVRVARHQGPTLFFSLEMSTDEVYERMIAAGGVDGNALRMGALYKDDWARFTLAAGELSDAGRIDVDDTGTLKISELRSRARRWRANQGKGENAVVVVDYLQLVNGSARKYDKREQEVAEVSRGLKALAKELNCVVIALAQLNRGADDRRPTMADLRESGQIEQDADIIGFLYREEVANQKCPPELKGTAELIVGKGRGMPTGTVNLHYDAKHVRFLPRQEDDEAPPQLWDRGAP